MHLNKGDEYLGYTIVDVVYSDHYKVIYSVTDKSKEKKKRTMVFIKKYQNKNTYNESVFELKDCLIQSIPQYTFRHSHFFPSVNIVSQEGNNIFICENLDCNIMSQFFEHDKRLPLDMICDYGYRMFHILRVLKQKSNGKKAFSHLCPYDFYESAPTKANHHRVFLLNQNFEKKSVPSFIRKFDSISVRKGEDATLIDNAISVCYILLFLYYGTLPWMVTSSKSEEIRLKTEFNDRELNPDTPTEIVFLMTTLNNLHNNPDSIRFQDIATSFRSMNGDNLESSFLDTTLSPPSSAPSTPARTKKAIPANETEKEPSNPVRLPTTIVINENELPKATQVKRGNEEETKKDEKKRKIWNTIKSVVINPILVSAAIVFGKYVMNSAQ